MDAETAYRMGVEGKIADFCEIMKAEQSIDPPQEAKTGRFRLGTSIMVSRESIGESYRNPDLPPWFAARVCMPPAEEVGNWYRWYDPFIWYETDFDLSNGSDWCTAKRNMCYVGRLAIGSRNDFWAIPMQEWEARKENEMANERTVKTGEAS